MKRLMLVLLLCLGCSDEMDANKGDNNANNTDNTPMLMECGDFAVCWEDTSNFDVSYAYENEGLYGVRFETTQRTDDIFWMWITVPQDIETGEIYELGEGSTLNAYVRQGRVDTPGGLDTAQAGQIRVVEANDEAIDLEVFNLQFVTLDNNVFLLKNAEIRFDCIGESPGNQCGAVTQVDRCGIERSFATEQCDG